MANTMLSPMSPASMAMYPAGPAMGHQIAAPANAHCQGSLIWERLFSPQGSLAIIFGHMSLFIAFIPSLQVSCLASTVPCLAPDEPDGH